MCGSAWDIFGKCSFPTSGVIDGTVSRTHTVLAFLVFLNEMRVGRLRCAWMLGLGVENDGRTVSPLRR